MAKAPSSKSSASKSDASKPAGKSGAKATSRAKGTGLIEEAPAKKRAELPPVVVGSMRDVVGQDRAIGVLQKSLASGRMHHAWIFHGPAGVGKFTTAVAFAATLLDPTSRAGLDAFIEPDAKSHVARLLKSGTHPDLHVIVKELARYHPNPRIRAQKLVQIPKEVIDHFLISPSLLAAAVPPGGLASKVFVVDEADRLERNAAAQNTILKTLEEPPPGTVIILVTSNEDRLLPTIRSRSQRVAFAPLDDDAMKKWMRARGVELPREQATWLLAHAAGSPGALLEALRDNLFEWHSALDPKLTALERGGAAPELGPVMTKLVDEWAEAFVKRDANASKEAANHGAMDVLFRMLAERCRTGLREGGPRVPSWLAALDHIRNAERHAGSNVSAGLLLGNLAAQWGAAFETVDRG
ncbi:MAG: DNA polymerase III subunit delta' [Phycisphaerales bacterium]